MKFFIVFFALGFVPFCAQAFMLVDEGKPVAVIVTPDEVNSSVSDGVSELNYWVERISGTTLPVIKASEWTGDGPFIAVGKSSVSQARGWEKGPMQQEEARVFIEDDCIGLIGNDENPESFEEWTGSYYAVLEFVRKKLGVDWIWPGPSGEVFTPSSRIEVDPDAWTWAPDLTLIRVVRNGYGDSLGRSSLRSMKSYFDITIDPESWNRLDEEHVQWLKRERMTVPFPTSTRFGHAFTKWWDKYSKDHPDWFAQPPEGLTQRGGHGVKLNLSSSEVKDKVIEEWIQKREREPDYKHFLKISPNDSRGFDTRPETRAMDAPEVQLFSDKEVYNGSETVLTDRYVKFWNELARRARDIDPQATAFTYAYRNYRKPPLEEGLMVEPNVMIAYVGGEGYYPDESFIRDEWMGWADRNGQLTWRPNLLHGGHGIPYNYSRELFEDFEFFRHHGMMGTDFDAMVGNWSGQGLVYYVLAEQHSRPDATYDELADEYYSAFGPAAGSIQKFNEYFAEQTEKAPELLRRPGIVPRMTWGGWWIGHVRIIPMFLTPEVMAEGNRILAEAQKEVAAGDPVYQERVDIIARGFTHACLMSEAFGKLNLQDPMATFSDAQARIALKPLWDFRMKHLTDLAVPVARCFTIEQQKMQLWNAFRGASALKAVSARESYPLVDGWEMKLDRDNRGNYEQWQTDWSDQRWMPVSVGMPWRKSLSGEGDSQVVWYRLAFPVPELSDTGEKVALHFDSVDAETKLWVNGKVLDERGYPNDGNYDSWAESFEVNITSVVKSGAENVLMMRVESEQKNGGITGPVSLMIGD